MGTFYDVLSIISIFVRALGLLVFGVTAGWLTLKVLNQKEINWKLQSVILVVFFGFLAFQSHSLTAGALGALLFGVSGGLVFWGMVDRDAKKESDPEK